MPKLMYNDNEIGGIGSNSDSLPVGSIIPFGSLTSIPKGFLSCDGTAVSRETYNELFDIIGTQYGEGNGTTTFNLPDLVDAAIMNGDYDKTEFITAGSDTFTAPKTGYYKITVKGAGGGGWGGKSESGGFYYGGLGGAEGGTTIAYEYMTLGDIAVIIIGAGGTGGPAGAGSAPSAGEDSSVTVNHNTYTGGGGSINARGFTYGGSGTVPGESGPAGQRAYNLYAYGGCGGGNGGGAGSYDTVANDGINGGGGGGGGASGSSYTFAGGKGGDGFATFEYIGTVSNYVIKAYLSSISIGDTLVTLTQAQYDALSTNEKNDARKLYVITDSGDAANIADNMPVGLILPYAANADNPIGFLTCDGSAVSRTMYPDLFALIGTTYGEGDGETTFNLPDLGFIDGEEAAIYGDGYALGLESNLPSKAGLNLNYGSNTYLYWNQNSSDLAEGRMGLAVKNSTDSPSGSHIYTDLTSAVSNKARYIIKAFNGATKNSALVDMTQVGNALNSKFDFGSDFTIIYPNGGTAEIPANVTKNSRYVMDNPFPGYIVNCIAEVLYNGEWGDPKFASDTNNERGVIATQFNDNTIVVQTAQIYVFTQSGNSGNPFGFSGSAQTTLPCRVKVWKIGKIPTT